MSKKISFVLCGLSFFVMVACGVVAYMQMVIRLFESGRYLLGVFLTALFFLVLSCAWGVRAIGKEEKRAKQERLSKSEQ